MTRDEMTGQAMRFISNAAERRLPLGCLFLADGVPVYPFQATKENVQRAVRFIGTFPLASATPMNDDEVLQFILDPNVVVVQARSCCVFLENLKLGLDSDSGFVFWDRKVAGNESLLREIYKNLALMFHLHRVTCRVPQPNRIMWRMLEKIGFQREGCVREAIPHPRGGFSNVLIYGALTEELVSDNSTAIIPVSGHSDTGRRNINSEYRTSGEQHRGRVREEYRDSTKLATDELPGVSADEHS